MTDKNIATLNITTDSQEYASYFIKKYATWWRFWLPTELPFKYVARILCKGKTLDIGCGPGRYLSFLSNAIGIDHNPEMVMYSRQRGFEAYTTEEFATLQHYRKPFDTLLFSHVIEHMAFENAFQLISSYLPLLKKQGRLVLIVPQGKSFKKDPTHICYFDTARIQFLAEKLHMWIARTFHHPFPEFLNQWLINDTIYLLRPLKDSAETSVSE